MQYNRQFDRQFNKQFNRQLQENNQNQLFNKVILYEYANNKRYIYIYIWPCLFGSPWNFCLHDHPRNFLCICPFCILLRRSEPFRMFCVMCGTCLFHIWLLIRSICWLVWLPNAAPTPPRPTDPPTHKQWTIYIYIWPCLFGSPWNYCLHDHPRTFLCICPFCIVLRRSELFKFFV